jgi:hypothetical protein
MCGPLPLAFHLSYLQFVFSELSVRVGFRNLLNLTVVRRNGNNNNNDSLIRTGMCKLQCILILLIHFKMAVPVGKCLSFFFQYEVSLILDW